MPMFRAYDAVEQEFVGHNCRETSLIVAQDQFRPSAGGHSWYENTEIDDVDMFNFLCDNAPEGDGPEESRIEFRFWILKLKGT